MRRIRFIVTLFFVGIFSWVSSMAQEIGNTDLKGIGPEAFAYLRQFYDYDQVVPLNASVIERIDEIAFVRERIIFDGMSGPVPGILAIPKSGAEPYPAVLLLHGLNSSKESWWDQNSTMWKLTVNLLESGYAVFTMDTQYHGERSKNSPFQKPDDLLNNGWFIHFRDMMAESVIDFRRGLDYLATRKEIDTSRIGTVGYSMGGIMTFILSAVDKRIDVSVSCVSPIISIPYFPMAVQNYAPYINEKPFLMLMAKTDDINYTKETANQLYNLLGTHKKQIHFFESGHMLPSEWTIQASQWIEKNLKNGIME